jgi:hypothetical protein
MIIATNKLERWLKALQSGAQQKVRKLTRKRSDFDAYVLWLSLPVARCASSLNPYIYFFHNEDMTAAAKKVVFGNRSAPKFTNTLRQNNKKQTMKQV